MRSKVLLGLGVLLLTACHQDNPLKTHSKKESATFLMNASANVEKRLKFEVKEGDRGYGYLECMEGQKNSEIDCQKLYAGMLRFAKEGHYAGFKKLNLSDLTDKLVFEYLADTYTEIMVSNWPTYYPEA